MAIIKGLTSEVRSGDDMSDTAKSFLNELNYIAERHGIRIENGHLVRGYKYMDYDELVGYQNSFAPNQKVEYHLDNSGPEIWLPATIVDRSHMDGRTWALVDQGTGAQYIIPAAQIRARP